MRNTTSLATHAINTSRMPTNRTPLMWTGTCRPCAGKNGAWYRRMNPLTFTTLTCRTKIWPHSEAAFFCKQSNLFAGNRQKVRHIWNFSIVQWIRYRPSLWAWAALCVYGAASICWRGTGPIIPPAMLMCGKVTHKNLIDSLHYSEKLTKKKQN